MFVTNFTTSKSVLRQSISVPLRFSGCVYGIYSKAQNILGELEHLYLDGTHNYEYRCNFMTKQSNSSRHTAIAQLFFTNESASIAWKTLTGKLYITQVLCTFIENPFVNYYVVVIFGQNMQNLLL